MQSFFVHTLASGKEYVSTRTKFEPTIIISHSTKVTEPQTIRFSNGGKQLSFHMQLYKDQFEYVG